MIGKSNNGREFALWFEIYEAKGITLTIITDERISTRLQTVMFRGTC